MSDTLCSQSISPAVSPTHEARTRWVVVITSVMMVVELVAGSLTHSLALTADGWHMATHAGALGVSALAYWYARTRAQHQDYTFGTGKVYALAGFTNAVVLLLVSLLVISESVARLLAPVPVDAKDALPVAIAGLVVNLISAWILDVRTGGHDHDHDHGHDHADEDDDDHDDENRAHAHGHTHPHAHDHNLRSAYLHVLSDVLTGVLAIFALLGARYFGWMRLDPVMGIVGSLVIMRWVWGLVRLSARQLLDVVPDVAHLARIRSRLEELPGTRVDDLHVWELGGGRLAGIVHVMSAGELTPAAVRDAVAEVTRIDHLTVQIDRA